MNVVHARDLLLYSSQTSSTSTSKDGIVEGGVEGGSIHKSKQLQSQQQQYGIVVKKIANKKKGTSSGVLVNNHHDHNSSKKTKRKKPAAPSSSSISSSSSPLLANKKRSSAAAPKQQQSKKQQQSAPTKNVSDNAVLLPQKKKKKSSAGTTTSSTTTTTTTTTDEAAAGRSSSNTFDFIVAGFPKCGTTTLLKAFGIHEETAMASSEQCAIASPGQADIVVHRKLDDTLATLLMNTNSIPSSNATTTTTTTTTTLMKRSFKCPTAMYNYKSIVRMEKHSPNAKFIVGMRHPIKMLQSFYNYRVTEIYEKKQKQQQLTVLQEEETTTTIPTLESIIESGIPWKGVSLEATKFELFLLQMGKTSISPEQMNELIGQSYELAIKPTTFQIFLYTVDQLDDTNPIRSQQLRTVMQNFLGLTKPIQPFGHENMNHRTGTSGHKETIDICDDKYNTIRNQLIEQGKKTAVWLRDHFIQSIDVTIANREHFIETLETWGIDPCTTISSSASSSTNTDYDAVVSAAALSA